MSNTPPAATPHRWMTLKEASDFLGIHFTTMRAWADRGDVRVFRTPGGHRRFSVEDLRRFLDERGHHELAESTNEAAAEVMETALVRVRQELDRTAETQSGWRGFHDNADHERRRRGRQLFSLALAYVLKPAQRERTLVEGRRLGREYGREAVLGGVNLAETGRAVQFFRGQLGEAIRHREPGGIPDADDLRIQQSMDQFLDEVLYAVLDGFEAAARGLLSGETRGNAAGNGPAER